MNTWSLNLSWTDSDDWRGLHDLHLKSISNLNKELGCAIQDGFCKSAEDGNIKPDEPYEETRLTGALSYNQSLAAFQDGMSMHDLIGLLWNIKTRSHLVCHALTNSTPATSPNSKIQQPIILSATKAHPHIKVNPHKCDESCRIPYSHYECRLSQLRITFHQKCLLVDASLLLWALVLWNTSLFWRQSIIHARGTMTP